MVFDRIREWFRGTVYPALDLVKTRRALTKSRRLNATLTKDLAAAHDSLHSVSHLKALLSDQAIMANATEEIRLALFEELLRRLAVLPE